jgi:hypothetical protein
MKKIPSLIFIILSLVITQYSQTKDKNTSLIVWGENSKCYEYNSPSIKGDGLQCFSTVVNGNTFYIIDYKGISYALSFTFLDEDILIATIQINNNSGREIFVNPVNSVISKYETEEQFRENRNASDNSEALAPKRVIDKFRNRRTVIEYRDEGGDEGVGVRAQSRVSREGSTAGMTIIEPRPLNSPDPPNSPLRRPNGVSTSVVTGKTIKVKNPLGTVLISKKLLDKEKIVGQVYFKRYKKAKFRAVFMKVDSLEFVFPLRK